MEAILAEYIIYDNKCDYGNPLRTLDDVISVLKLIANVVYRPPDKHIGLLQLATLNMYQNDNLLKCVGYLNKLQYRRHRNEQTVENAVTLPERISPRELLIYLDRRVTADHECIISIEDKKVNTWNTLTNKYGNGYAINDECLHMELIPTILAAANIDGGTTEFKLMFELRCPFGYIEDTLKFLHIWWTCAFHRHELMQLFLFYLRKQHLTRNTRQLRQQVFWLVSMMCTNLFIERVLYQPLYLVGYPHLLAEHELKLRIHPSRGNLTQVLHGIVYQQAYLTPEGNSSPILVSEHNVSDNTEIATAYACNYPFDVTKPTAIMHLPRAFDSFFPNYKPIVECYSSKINKLFK
jgi:hypothetical protein